jgi:hypothetical protein
MGVKLSDRPLMDLKRGFTIDDPPITIPWKITGEKLVEIGGRDGLEEVTRGYYVATCKALGGLDVRIGFHFDAGVKGRLREIELFGRFAKSLPESFAEFQRRLEQSFGPPTSSEQGTDGFAQHVWRKRGADVRHYVFERFGLEEHVRITKR